MYRELGLLFVLLLPVLLLYLSKQDSLQLPGNSKKKSKKKNKKKATKATPTALSDYGSNSSTLNDSTSTLNDNVHETLSSPTTGSLPSFVKRRYRLKQDKSNTSLTSSSSADEDSVVEEPLTNNTNNHSPKPKQQKSGKKNRFYPSTSSTASKPPKKAGFPPLIAPQSTQILDSNKKNNGTDSTSNYSRVLRIRTEPASKPVTRSQTKAQQDVEPLTKKQRQNQVRLAKQKELKAQADSLQEERLRQHQRQLENNTLSNKPKKSQHGSPLTSKRPTGKASLNEFGQLVWD